MLKFAVHQHTDTDSVEPHSVLYRLTLLILRFFCTVTLIVVEIYDPPYPKLIRFWCKSYGCPTQLNYVFEPGDYTTP